MSDLESRIETHVSREEDVEPDNCPECSGYGWHYGSREDGEERSQCEDCMGTGWKIDKDGVT